MTGLKARSLLGAIALLLACIATAGQGRYLEPREFLRQAFGGAEPEQRMLWVSAELRASIERIVGHRFTLLRIRYWQAQGHTAWILDEIGKEEPITIGISVVDGAVGLVRVLEFRETRGWEVRYPFFTDQYNGAALSSAGRIDKSIDGISGATLSVAAVSRAVQLALMLHEQVARPSNATGSAALARTD